VRKADIFLWSPEETTRNVFHDPAFAERLLALPVSDEQQMIVLKNRLATAKLGWQPRLYNPHLAKWLHRVSTPTLILWGEDDRVIPSQYGPAFAELIPGAVSETFTECGHLPQVEKADAFTARVTRFIEEAGR
jgi:pimeloyl-ACP methyl ester carboxylesterase